MFYLKGKLNDKYGTKINDGTSYEDSKAVVKRYRELENIFSLNIERAKANKPTAAPKPAAVKSTSTITTTSNTKSTNNQLRTNQAAYDTLPAKYKNLDRLSDDDRKRLAANNQYYRYRLVGYGSRDTDKYEIYQLLYAYELSVNGITANPRALKAPTTT